jgi:hypothetical protein
MKYELWELIVCCFVFGILAFISGGGLGIYWEHNIQNEMTLSQILDGPIYFTSSWDNVGENTTAIITHDGKMFIRYYNPEIKIMR